MNDTRLTTLVEHTFSRSDFAYRIGVLKEFLEFLFFASKGTQVTKETVDAFEKEGHPVADVAFLRSLPESFFAGLTKDSFHKELDQLADAAAKLPTLSLTIPVMLDAENRDAVGAWVRKELGKEVVLDIASDPEVSVGCQIVWHDKLHDFGFDHYLDASREKVDETIARAIPKATLFGKS